MILSNSISITGSVSTTMTTLMIAPRAKRMHMELIMSISEYTATPNVAENRPIPDTMIEGIEVASAVFMELTLSFPSILSFLYLVVINIA